MKNNFSSLFLSRIFSQIYLIIEKKEAKRKKLNKYRYFSTGLKNRNVYTIFYTYILYILSNIQTLSVSKYYLVVCSKIVKKVARKPYPGYVFPDFLNRCHEFARKSNDRFTKESKWNSALRDTIIYIYIYICVWVYMTFVIELQTWMADLYFSNKHD